MITIRVYGTPAPQGSKARGRHGGVYEMSKHLPAWRRAVIEACADPVRDDREASEPLTGPVALTVVFLMARPAMHFRRGVHVSELRPDAPARPATRPDISKLIRGTEDALTEAGIWGDDGQVADLCAAKVYCRPGDPPGARITIEPCKTEDY